MWILRGPAFHTLQMPVTHAHASTVRAPCNGLGEVVAGGGPRMNVSEVLRFTGSAPEKRPGADRDQTGGGSRDTVSAQAPTGVFLIPVCMCRVCVPIACCLCALSLLFLVFLCTWMYSGLGPVTTLKTNECVCFINLKTTCIYK